MRSQLTSVVERLRSSLFFVPLAGVVLFAVAAFAALALDSSIDADTELPLGIASTVESARALLGTVASATITFAAIAFSVSLLVIQQASNQYSPRVVQTLFRDPFNKRVLGLVLGTFTYCLLVLRSVRSALEPGGDPVVPNVSVTVAVVLGVGTILAVVAFVNRSAHSMDISEILRRARHEASSQLRRSRPERDAGARHSSPHGEPVHVVRFASSGWVQHVDEPALLEALPPGGTMVLHTYPGRFAVTGTPLCSMSAITERGDGLERSIRKAVRIGPARTIQQDPFYGIRTLADVALRALSPGVNDPTTAQDAIFNLASLLVVLLDGSEESNVRSGPDGRKLVFADQPTDEDAVALAFDEVRRAAASHPAVCAYLIDALAQLDEALGRSDGRRHELFARHAALVVANCENAELLPADLAGVRSAYRTTFADPIPHPPPPTHGGG